MKRYSKSSDSQQENLLEPRKSVQLKSVCDIKRKNINTHLFDAGCGGIWNKQERPVLETHAWPIFNSQIWFKEFFLQAFYPFTLPFYTKKRLINQCYFQATYFDFLLHNILQPMTWMLPIWFMIDKDKFVDGGTKAVEVFSPLVCMLAHRACVATKYSFLSQQEYDEFLKADKLQARIWLQNMQLITAWASVDISVACYEVWIAFRQLGLNLRNCFIIIDNKNDQESEENLNLFQEILLYTKNSEYKKYTDADSSSIEEGKISVFELTVCLLLKHEHLHKSKVFYLMLLFLTFIRSVYFGVWREVNGLPFLGKTIENSFMTIFSIILLFLFYGIVLALCLLGNTDIARRQLLINEIGNMIQISKEKGEQSPHIDLSIVENIGAWITMRRVIQRVGYRFQKRLFVQTFVLQILWIIFISEIIYLFTKTNSASNLKEDPQFSQGLIDSIILLVPLVLLTVHGAFVNISVRNDIEVLISHRIAFRVEKSKDLINEQDFQISESRDVMLQTAIQALKSMDISTPVTVLGIRAEFRFLFSASTLIGSFFLYVVRVVYFPTAN